MDEADDNGDLHLIDDVAATVQDREHERVPHRAHVTVKYDFDHDTELEANDGQKVAPELVVIDVRVEREVTIGAGATEAVRHPGLVVGDLHRPVSREYVVAKPSNNLQHLLNFLLLFDIIVVNGSLILNIPQV